MPASDLVDLGADILQLFLLCPQLGTDPAQLLQLVREVFGQAGEVGAGLFQVAFQLCHLLLHGGSLLQSLLQFGDVLRHVLERVELRLIVVRRCPGSGRSGS